MADYFSKIKRRFHSLGRVEAIFIGLAFATLVVRLVSLGDKPLHHDESLHAWFSWRFLEGEGYQYDPVYHGPVQFLLMTISYVFFGVSDFTARIAPVVMGSVVVGLPYFLRKRIGVTAAVFCSVLLAISPSFFYFSRFAREDIYVACFTLGLIAALFSFLDEPKKYHPALILSLLALSFATKESTFITIFLIGTFLIVLVVRQSWGEPLSETKLIKSIRSLGLDAWLWGISAFLFVFALLFTTFFTNLGGMEDGLLGGLRYWLSQQPVERGNQPLFFYVVLLGGYEWPIMILGIIGGVIAIRERTIFGVFLVWFAIGSFLVYSWAGERMPWLTLHPLLPMVILASLTLAKMWEQRSMLWMRAGFAFVLVGAAYLVYSAFNVSYRNPADPKELFVYTQSAPDITEVRDEIVALNEEMLASKDRPLRVVVDSSMGATWPWAWYLRDIPNVAYVDLLQGTFDVEKTDVVLLLDSDRARFGNILGDFEQHPYQHRVWWTPDYASASTGDWLAWLIDRDPWNPKGSLDAWLMVNESVPGADRIAGFGI